METTAGVPLNDLTRLGDARAAVEAAVSRVLSRGWFILGEECASFEGEFVDSWEIGAKSTLFDGKFLLNVAIFDQKYDNFQLNTFLGTSFVVESIPELNSKGVDVDFIWFTPMEGLTVQGGVTRADTEYGNFTAADLIAPSHFPSLSLLPGNTMSFAPKWSSSIAFSYDHDIGGNMRFTANLGAKYTSEYNTKSDLLPALIAARDGELDQVDLRWHPEPVMTVIMAAKGYPDAPEKGSEIRNQIGRAHV